MTDTAHSDSRTTFTYDALNRQTDVKDPLGNSATFAYDAASRLISSTDRLGRRRDFTFDDVNRKLTEKWYTSGNLDQTQTFTWDANGNLLTAVDPDGSSTFTYDALNRVSTVQQPFGLGLTYTYDAADNRTLVEDSLGGRTTSAYDAANRMTSVQFTGNSATLRYDYAYTVRDQVEKLTRYSALNGTGTVGWTSYTYDSRMRLTNLQHRDSSNTSLENTTYTYDAHDRLTVKTVNGTATTYTYDDTDQLTNDTANAYSYDANGNRTGGGYTTGTGNRTSNDGTWTYTYDTNGNRTRRSKGASLETWDYEYDHQNRLIAVEKRSAVGGALQLKVQYKYDALGHRIERTLDSDGNGSVDTTERFGDDGEHVWADLDGTNTLTARRLFGISIDSPVARVSSGTVAWYLTDYQNSVTQIVNGVGTLGSITYDGFGNIVTDTTGGNGDRYKYTGREWDASAQLQYNRARYYDPALGRWTSMDPIGFEAGDANLYRYVTNSSTNWVDPSGQDHDETIMKRNKALADLILDLFDRPKIVPQTVREAKPPQPTPPTKQTPPLATPPKPTYEHTVGDDGAIYRRGADIEIISPGGKVNLPPGTIIQRKKGQEEIIHGPGAGINKDIFREREFQGYETIEVPK